MTLLVLLALSAAQPPKVPLDAYGRPDYQAALNDRLSKGVTPETNANVLLWKAFGPRPEGGDGMPPEYFQRLGIPEPPKQGDYFTGMTEFARDRLKIAPDAFTGFYDQQGQASKRPWTAKEFPQLAAWLAANEKPLTVVLEATKRPAYYNPLVTKKSETEHHSLIGALLPSVQKCRELAAALTARAMLRVSEGKGDEAWQDLLACHRLGRLIARGTMIESLVGIAVDAVATNATLAFIDRGGQTAAQLRDRLKDFAALPPMPPIADTIDVAERHFFLDTVQMLRRGNFDAVGGDRKMSADDQKAWEALDWSPVFDKGNKFYDRMAAAMRLPTRPERLAALGKTELDLDATAKAGRPLAGLLIPGRFGKDVVNSIGDVLIGLLMPAIGKVTDAADRAQQFDRNVRVAFALAVYHKENGRYPATLDVLAPRVVAAVPGDVFTGRGLVYRREGAGYLLYSLGVNGKDDGGRGSDDEPRGDDWRVRMPIADPPKK